MPLRFLRIVTMCAAGLLIAGSAAASAAGAATTPRWRITAVLRHCGDDSLSAVAATSPRNAWALGQPQFGSGGSGCGADVEHWDGAAWHRVPVPASVALGDSLTPSLAATSASDAWIFPVKMTNIGLSYFAYNYALHWNGKAWHASAFPVKMVLQSAADLGPGDVWAFGVIMSKTGTVVPYAARFNGKVWHHVVLPAAPLAIGTTGHAGLWVIGPTTATAALPAGQQHITGTYWNGKSWRSLAVPKVKVPAGQSSFTTASLATNGPRDLWWSYRADNGTTDATRSGLLHWNGRAWHAIAVPSAIADVEAVTPDGHGGIWLAAGTGLDLAQYWYHYTGGSWTRTPVPSPKDYTIMLFGMAWIPGTASVWADGEADANTGTHTVGVIEKYGA